jgi:hypothetical protein
MDRPHLELTKTGQLLARETKRPSSKGSGCFAFELMTYSGIVSPEPPIAAGKSFSFGKPSGQKLIRLR